MTEALERAVALHRGGDVAGARQAALDGLAADATQVDLLHFLGMMDRAAGRLADARHHLERAASVEPSGLHVTSLARLLAEQDPAALAALQFPAMPGPAGDELLSLRSQARIAAGMAREAALDLAELARRHPDDRAVALAAAAQWGEAGETAAAKSLFERLLATNRNDRDALLGLVGLLEASGLSADLAAMLTPLRPFADPRAEALAAMLDHRGADRFAEAQRAFEGSHGLLPEGTHAQLAGELADRAGDPQAAMASFAAMNAADAAATPQWREGVTRYHEMLARSLDEADSGKAPGNPGDGGPSPLFLLGFPRSGTTLLDTFLMGHPAFEVHEERPFLDAAAAQPDTVSARAAYRSALAREMRDPSRIQVDKYPLASARAPLIHRMFPDARYLFALRHPCDVVLSCFMTRFRLNWGVSAFLHLDDAVRTYDRVMTVWQRSRMRFDLSVHEVRYEELIEDPGQVLRGIADFAGAPFDPAMLEHQDTAAARGMISTPSHGQVVQPLYKRAAGRWHRYRDQLEPYFAQLEPWCTAFGYDLSPIGS